ncbi:MAG: hypothetical protein M3346_10715, partial [Actinomycetota bacterium]|nr:hypothetical protein [Actinomycetota bacterium]
VAVAHTLGKEPMSYVLLKRRLRNPRFSGARDVSTCSIGGSALTFADSTLVGASSSFARG